MSNEEYIIDNLITEARFFIDHRDDNETFLSQSQDSIDKINQILKKNIRSSFLDISQEVIIKYCEACLIVPDKAHIAQQYIDLYFQRNTSQGQFYIRALFIKARLISMNGHDRLLKAEDMIKNLKLSLTYVQQGLDIISKPENKQKYGFLIYNASICVYNIIRPMLKPQWQLSFVDILDKIDKMFEEVDEADYDWRCRFTWLLFYCLYDDRKADAFKLLDRLWETTKKKGDCDFQNSLLRLRIHIGKEYKQALDSAFKESESAPSEKAWKSLFMLQKMRSGLIPEAQVEKELINLINSISSAVLPGNEVAATNKLAPVFQERLAESGRVALQYNLVNIADSITAFLSRVRQLHQKAYILHEYNKAELFIKKAGPLIDNKTGMRLNSLQIKMQEVERRIEALKTMEKVMVTNKKLNDPDLIFEGAVLIWNISLPFLNAQYRVHVYKAFSMACQLLEQLQCVDHALRVNFHIELAKSDLQEDLAVKAEQHIKKALQLDYSVPLGKVQFKYDEGEDLGLYQRPYDKYLRNLEEKIRLKLNIYQEPKNDIERVITQLENVQAAKSENLRIDILQKCLGTIVNLQEQEYWYDTKLDLVEEEQNREKVLKKQENLYQFKQKKLLAAEIARLAFEWEFNDLAFKACEFVCNDTWDVKNASEMILAQVECQYRMAQMIIDNLIKDNFEIPFADPIRVEENENVEELSQEKKDQVLSLKRKMCSNFVKGLKLADSIKQTWLVFNGAIYIWNNFLTIFRNPINDSKLLPEITNLLKEFFEIMKNSLKEIEKKLINDYDIDTKIQVLANIGLVYARLMEGKAQYDEVMRVCEALLLTPLSPHTRKLINSIKARVSGTAKTSAAKPGAQQDKKGTKQPQQSSSDSVIFDVVSQLEIIQNSTNKAQTQDLIKKCFETLVGWTAKENDETELELHAELWARLARLSLNEETILMYKYSLRCVQYSLQLLTSDLSTIPASRLRWYSLAEYIYSENLLRMLNTETQETESQESLLFSSLFHAIEAANKGLKAGINSLVLDASKQVWNLCARLEESAQNRKHLIKPVYSCLNYLKECKEKSEPDLVLLLAQLLFKSALENEDYKLGEMAADMVFELVPKNMAKPIWEAKMIFMSKQGKNELQAIVNMKEADASLQAKVWIRLARVSNNLYKQYTAYNKAIELLKKDSSVEIVEVLIEFSEWLLRNGNEKQLVIENLMQAADTLIEIEMEDDEEEEEGDEEQNSSTIFSRSTRGKKSTVSKQSKQKSKMTKKTTKNTVKQNKSKEQKSQISGQKSSNQRFSRAANVRTTTIKSNKQKSKIFRPREEEANPNRLNCAHYERLMRIHIMLAMIADTMEQSIQFAIDAKVFLIKIIEISFQTMNEFEENAAKYTNIIDEKTSKQQQQQPKPQQQDDFSPRYLLPTCIQDWIKLQFSKEFLERVKSYEDFNFMGKYLFDKAQLTYTYINNLMSIFEKYGLQIHNIPIFVFQKFFVKEILNNSYLDRLIDVKFSKCLHLVGFHSEADQMYQQSNIVKFKLTEQEKKQLLAKTESSVLQQNRSRPADIMEQNLPQANIISEIFVYTILTDLGNELIFQGEIYRAKELLAESHKHAKIVSDLELMGRILCLQGQIAFLEGEFKDSIENHKLSHKLIKNVSQWEISSIETYKTLYKLGKYDDIRQFLKQITEVLLEVLNKPNYQPNKLQIYQTLTTLYILQSKISAKDLFKEFSYEAFKLIVENLEKSLKCIQHGGFMTHQVELIINLVNKILIFIRNRNYTKIDQVEIYFKILQRLQNSILKPLEQQSRSLLKYTLLIEKEQESIRSPIMDQQAKIRVIMASCFIEMGLIKWLRKQQSLPDLQGSDDDNNNDQQEDKPIEQLSNYEPLQKFLTQLTIKIQRAIQPLPQRLESFEKATAILISTLKQLKKDSFWYTIAEIELVRAKRFLAISKQQLDDVWDAPSLSQDQIPQQNEEDNMFDYKTDALQSALKLIKDLESKGFNVLKAKGDNQTIPLEWSIFGFKQMNFYLKMLYESALDILGIKSPEISYDYMCKFQHFSFCEQMFNMVRQSFFGKHKMIVYIRLIKMINAECGYLSLEAIKLLTEANKLWDNLMIFPLTELQSQLQQSAGFFIMQMSQNKTCLYLGYLHNTKSPVYKVQRLPLDSKSHDQMNQMKSNLDQIKNNLIKTPIIQQQDFIKLEDDMEKEYGKYCQEVESFMSFVAQMIDENINTQEEVPPPVIDPKAPPPKKDQGKQTKGKPGKDELAQYESTLEQAPGKIDTVVLLLDPKFFDYPVEQLSVFYKVAAMSRDFSMSVYVRRLKSVGFQVQLNNSQKGIEKDKLKYLTYDFKTEDQDLNLDEFNLQKTLTEVQKTTPQLKFEGTFSQSRLASLGELQKYSQTGSSILWYGSPGVLNILSSKVIIDLSEINTSKFWVIFDKMNAKKSLIEKFTSLDPDGEKTHILEQSFKISVFLTLIDVSTILTTQWSPQTVEYLRAFENLIKQLTEDIYVAACLQKYKAPIIKYEDENGNIIEKKPQPVEVKKGAKAEPVQDTSNWKEIQIEKKRIYTHNFVFVGLPNLRLI
ncbi:unnamed protein product [Paramecium octaurelia]|uniref:Uncharacterized protein n=1 Tax=Paramecium octaurelia TaxID=43137 RepID=A0A8S1S7N4_PAROT|nr:unnamed protein product [Paramecium octaurelia]